MTAQEHGAVGCKRRTINTVGSEGGDPSLTGGIGSCKRRCGAALDSVHRLFAACKEKETSVQDLRAILGDGLDATGSETLKATDIHGRMPIYYAIDNGLTIDVVKFLFDGYPGAMTHQSMCGVSALSLLYQRDQPREILEYVLEREPRMALFKPVSFSARPIVDRTYLHFQRFPFSVQLAESLKSDPDQRMAWNKMVLTVRAAYRATEADESALNMPELHLALRYFSSTNMISHFLAMYPEQKWLEYQRYYPLHLLCQCHVSERQAQPGFREVLRHLVESVGSEKDANMNTFIHRAIENGLSWENGMDMLLSMAPESLTAIAGESHFPPFLTAAVEPGASLSTLFCLLRENPPCLLPACRLPVNEFPSGSPRHPIFHH